MSFLLYAAWRCPHGHQAQVGLRRHGHDRSGGEGCGYAASLGQRKRVAHIPTAEAPGSGLIFLKDKSRSGYTLSPAFHGPTIGVRRINVSAPVSGKRRTRKSSRSGGWCAPASANRGPDHALFLKVAAGDQIQMWHKSPRHRVTRRRQESTRLCPRSPGFSGRLLLRLSSVAVSRRLHG